jgi:hypothetical protein
MTSLQDKGVSVRALIICELKTLNNWREAALRRCSKLRWLDRRGGGRENAASPLRTRWGWGL